MEPHSILAFTLVAALSSHHGHEELWSIEIRCTEGTLRLDNGGELLSIDGVRQAVSEEGEYAAVYRHFQQLIGDNASDLDLQPLRRVADSFFVGSRTSVEPFYDEFVVKRNCS